MPPKIHKHFVSAPVTSSFRRLRRSPRQFFSPSSAAVPSNNLADIKITRVSTPKAAQLVVGPHIFVSGQMPADASGNIIEGSVAEQTAACCENVKNILEAAGSSIARVVKVTVYLVSMHDFAEMNGVYETYFGTYKPARSCVAVSELPKGIPVEIEAIALSGRGA